MSGRKGKKFQFPPTPVRPPVVHLGGEVTPCCGSFVYFDRQGTYQCSCGKKREREAQKILRKAMFWMPESPAHAE